jgi:hypothetical protein
MPNRNDPIERLDALERQLRELRRQIRGDTRDVRVGAA